MIGEGTSVGVLQAYFDESGRAGGVFCVAGYVFVPEQAKKFIKEWRLLFGEYGGSHMKELVHRRKRFSGISQKECDRLLHEAVAIINRRMTVGVAVSCNIAEMEALSPKRFVRGYGNAYPVCCHLAMENAVLGLQEAGMPGPISYVFEAPDIPTKLKHGTWFA